MQLHLKSELFNRPGELHAFLIGLGETYVPWHAYYWLCRKEHDSITEEYHYYMSGRATGFLLLIITITAAVLMIRG